MQRGASYSLKTTRSEVLGEKKISSSLLLLLLFLSHQKIAERKTASASQRKKKKAGDMKTEGRELHASSARCRYLLDLRKEKKKKRKRGERTVNQKAMKIHGRDGSLREMYREITKRKEIKKKEKEERKNERRGQGHNRTTGGEEKGRRSIKNQRITTGKQ